MRRIGSDAAGWLSAGRPRREAFRVALRACSRRGAAELVERARRRAGALALHARALRDALAADYTYLQAAQPTTAGHLLLAYAYPALRDAERLRATPTASSRAASPARAAAPARAGRSIARGWPSCSAARASCTHAKDAAWQWDVYAELLATLAIAATHLSQLAQDFEIYASHEFGLIELADRHSRASALMPQKRNPYALAAIRTQAGQAAGDVAAVLTVTHTGSARTDHFHLLNGLVPRALEEAGAVARLAAAVLAGMRVDTERMARVAREGFTNAADVADVLAASGGLDYRTAHKVVGLAVRRLVEQGAGELTAEAVAEAALELTGTRGRRRSRRSSTRQPARRRGSRPARRRAPRWTRCWPRWMLSRAAERAWARDALAAAEAAEALLLERAAALAAG